MGKTWDFAFCPFRRRPLLPLTGERSGEKLGNFKFSLCRRQEKRPNRTFFTIIEDFLLFLPPLLLYIFQQRIFTLERIGLLNINRCAEIRYIHRSDQEKNHLSFG